MFQAKCLRKATKSQEFRRSSFALLFHSTVHKLRRFFLLTLNAKYTCHDVKVVSMISEMGLCTYGYGYLPLIALFYSCFVDITGDPEKSRLEVFVETNDSLAGNPFSVLSHAQTDSVDSDTASEADESVFAISALDDHQFADLEQRYAHMWLCSKLYVSHVNTSLSPVIMLDRGCKGVARGLSLTNVA